jgi:hypothetical protein
MKGVKYMNEQNEEAIKTFDESSNPPFQTCNECGSVIKEEAGELVIEVDGSGYCQSCIEEHFVTCESCNDLLHSENAEQDGYNSYCYRCYENSYARCDDCGAIVFQSDIYHTNDNAYCQRCYSDNDRGDDDDDDDDFYIHNYNYRPNPKFYGTGDRYFGVELEIDEGGQLSGNAAALLSLANRNSDLVYIKADGSLIRGLEIVTHPMTLEYHETTMPWNALLEKVKEMDYLSHKTDTCGLHIHVNRTTFGSTLEVQEQCISRVLYFVEHHWEDMLIFSRRTVDQMKQWAARYGYRSNPQEVLNHAKSGCLGRYTCVNITNYDTIEFRMFRGTLKYNTLIAALQMVNAICDAAVLMSNDEISGLSWSGFVRELSVDKYAALITYLKARHLYVNEEINYGEDD